MPEQPRSPLPWIGYPDPFDEHLRHPKTRREQAPDLLRLRWGTRSAVEAAANQQPDGDAGEDQGVPDRFPEPSGA